MSSKSGFPSFTALLALLAVAGYQNREKIGELLQGAKDHREPTNPASESSSPGGLLAGLGGLSAGGLLSGGLSELFKRFQGAGLGDVTDTWVRTGPNQPTSAGSLETALGTDTLVELERKTGLGRDEILKRLENTLPDAVDKYTPDGRLPAA